MGRCLRFGGLDNQRWDHPENVTDGDSRTGRSESSGTPPRSALNRLYLAGV